MRIMLCAIVLLLGFQVPTASADGFKTFSAETEDQWGVETVSQHTETLISLLNDEIKKECGSSKLATLHSLDFSTLNPGTGSGAVVKAAASTLTFVSHSKTRLDATYVCYAD